MRVYVPATSRTLAVLADKGVLGPAPLTAFAVTPGLREWYVDDDAEELEYAAMLEAARASLRMVATAVSVSPRRVVIAADVADNLIVVRDDLDRGVVTIAGTIPIGWCASVHADDSDAEDTVAAAAAVVDAADIGDPAAEEIVDDADGYELAWYATQEVADLLASMTPPPD